MKKYRIYLQEEERKYLTRIVDTGKRAAQTINRARILLWADESDQGPAWTDEQIHLMLGKTVQTVERIRKQFVEEGFDAVLTRRPYTLKHPKKKIDGHVEAHLVALACSEPPSGHARWTLHLLADRLVELRYVESISHEAVRKTLKKTNSSRG